jgi:peroxin-13
MGSYGMGGMYGGLGGMSSYGGYGGMGGMYGGGMYGGMGMPGMEQSPNLMNSMIALQSLGFLVNSLSEIARSLDQNYEGLQLFK